MPLLQSLLVSVEPLTPEHTINDVSHLLLDEKYAHFLSLPVVADSVPLGMITRTALQHVYLHRFGRDLYGSKSVTALMNTTPLIVEIDVPMDQASQYITQHIQLPIAEDFILTRDGKFCGLGHVIDLLKAMENQLTERTAQVAMAYRQLKASQSQLVQSEKMASLGQMIAGVAHEINTPLGYVKSNVVMARDIFYYEQSIIMAYDELLLLLQQGDADKAVVNAQLQDIAALRHEFSDAFAPEDVESLFSDTLYGVDQISEIVLNLKNFSRLDSAPVDSISVNHCIDSALLIARNVLKNKTDIIKRFDDVPMVRCAPSQINQVFLNLLTNAAQAISERGRIVIKTYADEKYVHVSILDTGKGMEPAILKKIFDPFFTTKPVGEGTGLGLSISYKIIKEHQGFIRVASEVGRGTRFVVSLPLSA